MRPLRWIALAVLAAFAACMACTFPRPYGYAQFQDVPPATCQSSYRQTFLASEFTDPVEQAQLRQAAEDWLSFSLGQINMNVVFEGTAPATIHRVISTEPIVKSEEAVLSTPDKPFSVDGWEKAQTIYLVVDRVPTSELHTLAAHELGHAAGLRWPLCTLTSSECVHSPDPAAVMAPAFSGAPAFTPSDLALCRASCLCP